MVSAVINTDPHPVYPLLRREEIERHRQKSRAYLAWRHKRIEEERASPMELGWEPPIWKVCDALFDLNFVNKQRDPEGWLAREDWNRAMREHLGFKKRLDVLLINGGNRGSKSEYAARRTMLLLHLISKAKAWCLHSKTAMSVQYQQPLLWKYMPAHLKTGVRGQEAYISYKTATGFSTGGAGAGAGFILPNLSDCFFLNYEMDISTIEGGELDWIWADELCPLDWEETMEFRIATRQGRQLHTFTPVEGYTSMVRMFQDKGEIARYSTAFLDPCDTDPLDLVRALGLRSEAELRDAGTFAPRSRPENCDEWLTGGTGQPEAPEGRKFHQVPRVMRSVTGKAPDGSYRRGVVWFHSSDNPFGNPQEVAKAVLGKRRAEMLMRFYGLAEKTVAASFPKFNESVHVIDPSGIPEHGTNFMLCDPSTARNWFMLWIRATKDNRYYVYREWPGNFEIPGVGYPGPWAETDGKKLDGKRGPAQSPFGWGMLRYKQEIARLERWADYDPSAADMERVELWNEYRRGSADIKQAPEVIMRRVIDSRAADSPWVKDSQQVTLHSELWRIGLNFELSKVTRRMGRGEIREGVGLINSMLDYDENSPVDYTNRPRLYVSRNCHNTIFALQSWTGEDGNKGACKEPIDLLRYALATECQHVDEGALEPSGGGYL